MQPTDIGNTAAHGTGPPLNDAAETLERLELPYRTLEICTGAVSYTHLTLPTSDLV